MSCTQRDTCQRIFANVSLRKCLATLSIVYFFSKNIYISGDPQDGVVVCTDTKTFDIKMCTTSNELLVSSDLIIPRSKDGPEAATADLVLSVHDYMEPKEMLPKLDKLQRLLPTFALSNDRKVFSNQFSFSSEKYFLPKSEPKGVSTAELLDRVQSSKFQIQEELKRLEAIDRDGWKVVTDMEKVSYSICTAIGKIFLFTDKE
jgi:hypothetical protein